MLLKNIETSIIKKLLIILMTIQAMLITQALGGILPNHEEKILLKVAEEYHLTKDETCLLLTIRRIENGRNGLELGVGDGIKNHPARRYAGNPLKSLKLQAQWAAGTIKKRYHGNLISFAKRYCPPNWRVWQKNATFYMRKQLSECPVKVGG